MKVRRLARRRLMATASGLALSAALMAAFDTQSMAGALPTAGQYIVGKGIVGQGSQSVVVKQATTTGIIDWSSFSIGRGNSVTFENGNGATLNEVTGGDLSTIAGSLHASGSLYLINQSGVIVSGSGRIVTGGSFGASTAGPDGTQRGNIVDAGTIRSAHGAVRLSGRNVSVPGSVAVMRGGQIWLTSSGTTAVSGALDADNARGAGGTIVATGKTVDVASSAIIRASGAQGGTILIGGDVHGGAIAADDFVKQTVADAVTTAVAKGAAISANGTKGSGGNVVIWSDGHTSFDGAIRATGTTRGGFSEVSSHDLLAFEGTADLLSPSGKTGTLLLDPENVTIENATTTGGSFSGGSPNIFTPTADNSVLDVSDLEAALASANVHVTTGSTGSQAGTITVASPFTWTSSSGLELNAAGSIVFDAAVTGTNAILYLIAGSTVSSNSSGVLDVRELRVASNGAVTLNAANDIGVLGAATTNNGDFSLTNNATLPVDGALDAGTGTVTLTTTGSNSTLGVQAAVTGSTVDLVSSGVISSSTAGIVTAGTLTGSSNGRATLNAANQITDLGAFSTNDGEFELTNAGSLTVTGAIDAGSSGNLSLTTTSGDLGIQGPLTGDIVALVSAGSTTANSAGVIDARELRSTSSGDVTLDAANAIDILGAITTSGGAFSLTDGEGLAIDGALDAGSGNVTLTLTNPDDRLGIQAALTGGTVDLVSEWQIVTNPNGLITAHELTGSSNGSVYLGYGNVIEQISEIGAFTTGGADFTLFDGVPLSIVGALNAGSESEVKVSTTGATFAIGAPVTGGVIILSSYGSMSQNAAGAITADILAVGAEANITLNAANDVTEMNATIVEGGSANISFSDAAPLIVAGVEAGTGTITITTTGTDNDLAIDTPLSGGTVNLNSSGNVTEGSAEGGTGSITANLLNVTANTGITLTSSKNDITTVGTDTTNSGPNEIDQH